MSTTKTAKYLKQQIKTEEVYPILMIPWEILFQVIMTMEVIFHIPTMQMVIF